MWIYTGYDREFKKKNGAKNFDWFFKISEDCYVFNFYYFILDINFKLVISNI